MCSEASLKKRRTNNCGRRLPCDSARTRRLKLSSCRKETCGDSIAVKRIAAIFAVLTLGFASRAFGQITRGDTSLDLNATVSVGYTDDFSNQAGSDHSITGSGSADLSGSYFNPNFLSFDIQPFYNQSRVNSNFQSLTNSSGVTAS